MDSQGYNEPVADSARIACAQCDLLQRLPTAALLAWFTVRRRHCAPCFLLVGSVNVNVAPTSAFDLPEIFPPWLSTMDRVTRRPIPIPWGLVVTNGSNNLPRTNGSIP